MIELIIDKKKDVEQIALVENGKLIEWYENDEEKKKNRLEGNIYYSKVTDILPGMQAAFVDFGENKKGFIHLKDVVPQIDEKKEKFDTNLTIKDVVKVNDNLLVQVKKDAVETKGARVSTHISIPSKYIVYMPNTTIITISQKIENEERKKELLKYVSENLPKGNGAIIRTSAIEASNEDILNDINQVVNKWEDIKKQTSLCKKAPKLISQSEEIQEKIITDLAFKDLEKVIVNDEKEYNKLKKNIEMQKFNVKIELQKDLNILDKYDIEKQVEKIQNRKIWLNCGGFITIDKTEALTAIDVNTGKFTGTKDLEKTIFKVNKEATIQIAKELRLRDIGGIIIIDYIDMKNNDNKKEIQELLKNSLKSDRAKTQIEGFTNLNLMELTRKCILGTKD